MSPEQYVRPAEPTNEQIAQQSSGPAYPVLPMNRPGLTPFPPAPPQPKVNKVALTVIIVLLVIPLLIVGIAMLMGLLLF